MKLKVQNWTDSKMIFQNQFDDSQKNETIKNSYQGSKKDKLHQRVYSAKPYHQRKEAQTILKQIQMKKAKVDEHTTKLKQKNNCYNKLAQKLKEDLKNIDDYSSNIAREKLKLYEKCMRSKHDRTKMVNKISMPAYKSANISRYQSNFLTQMAEFNDKSKIKLDLKERNENSPIKIAKGQFNNVHQKKTLQKNIPKRLKSAIFLNNSEIKQNFDEPDQKNRIKKKDNSKKCSEFSGILEKIKRQCWMQKQKSQELHKNFGLVQFYQNLIFRNTGKIIKKIL